MHHRCSNSVHIKAILTVHIHQGLFSLSSPLPRAPAQHSCHLCSNVYALVLARKPLWSMWTSASLTQLQRLRTHNVDCVVAAI